jgi:hypothetical protein
MTTGSSISGKETLSRLPVVGGDERFAADLNADSLSIEQKQTRKVTSRARVIEGSNRNMLVKCEGDALQ